MLIDLLESSKAIGLCPMGTLAVCPLNVHNFVFKRSIVFSQTKNKPEKL